MRLPAHCWHKVKSCHHWIADPVGKYSHDILRFANDNPGTVGGVSMYQCVSIGSWKATSFKDQDIAPQFGRI